MTNTITIGYEKRGKDIERELEILEKFDESTYWVKWLDGRGAKVSVGRLETSVTRMNGTKFTTLVKHAFTI